MGVITELIGIAAVPLGFTDSAVKSLSCGFFEITLGTKAAAEAAAPLVQKVTAASIILGWSGVSVLAQVAAMINETDLKLGLFTLTRFLQSVLSGALCFITLNCESVIQWLAKPVSTGHVNPIIDYNFISSLLFFSRLCTYTISIWILAGVIIYLTSSLRIIRIKV